MEKRTINENLIIIVKPPDCENLLSKRKMCAAGVCAVVDHWDPPVVLATPWYLLSCPIWHSHRSEDEGSPSLGLALPGLDPKFANVQPASETPKHPREKTCCYSASCLLPISKCFQDLWGNNWKKLLLITLKLNIPLSVQYFLNILLNFTCVYNCNITFVFCAWRELISKAHLRVFTKDRISQTNLHAERDTYILILAENMLSTI